MPPLPVSAPRASRLHLLALLLLVPLAGCANLSSGGTGASATLSGTVTYLPRIALPPDAVVHVRLEDVSRADAAALTLAERTIPTRGRQVPIPFELTYDPTRVEEGRRYHVRATIRDGEGNLLWTTDTAHPVLAAGIPTDEIEVRVVQVSGAGGGALVGPTWRLVRIEPGSGAPITPDADEPYSIAFESDGRYGGRADCNRFGGEYETEPGGDLALEPGPMTLVGCAPPSVSDAFLSLLLQVERFRIAAGVLRLEAGDGGALVFERGDGPAAVGIEP